MKFDNTDCLTVSIPVLAYIKVAQSVKAQNYKVALEVVLPLSRRDMDSRMD